VISLILLPFVHRAIGSLSFVCLLTNEQTEVICLQTDQTDLPIFGNMLISVICSVADPHKKNADADPGKNLDVDPDADADPDADSCPY
jgi:hypothetical protein